MSRSICPSCGQPVSFITVDGRSTPLHSWGGGGCKGGDGWYSQTSSNGVWTTGNVCWPTACPECKATVFFVRHNGGSAWFDRLGHPWPKHPCMMTRQSEKRVLQGLPQFPPEDVVGVVVANLLGMGGSKLLCILWENGTLGRYSYPGCVREKGLRRGKVVLFRPIDGRCVRTVSGRRVILDSKPLNTNSDIEFVDIAKMVEFGRRRMVDIRDGDLP